MDVPVAYFEIKYSKNQIYTEEIFERKFKIKKFEFSSFVFALFGYFMFVSYLEKNTDLFEEGYLNAIGHLFLIIILYFSIDKVFTKYFYDIDRIIPYIQKDRMSKLREFVGKISEYLFIIVLSLVILLFGIFNSQSWNIITIVLIIYPMINIFLQYFSQYSIIDNRLRFVDMLDSALKSKDDLNGFEFTSDFYELISMWGEKNNVKFSDEEIEKTIVKIISWIALIDKKKDWKDFLKWIKTMKKLLLNSKDHEFIQVLREDIFESNETFNIPNKLIKIRPPTLKNRQKLSKILMGNENPSFYDLIRFIVSLFGLITLFQARTTFL